MSDYGREWARYENLPREERLEFQVRTLRDSLEKHKRALAALKVKLPEHAALIDLTLWETGYDVD